MLFSQLKAKPLESGGGGLYLTVECKACLTIGELMCSKATSQKEKATSRAPSFPLFLCWPLSECIHRLRVFPPLASLALPFTH